MSGPEELRRKLRANVATLGERYFVDADEEHVGGETVDHWKLTLGAFTYLANRNVLLVGEPGTGKTTFASVVAAGLSGLPYDLFARTQVQGHPDQTKEEMLARPHVGALTTEGREEVVWQNTLFVPLVLIDEFNRLPEGKQSILQEYIRTGAVSHLNETFHRDDVAFAATVNEDDRGTYEVTPPNRDRFDVSIEFTHGTGWLQEHVQRAWEAVQRDLALPDTTADVLERLGDDDATRGERLEHLAEKRADLRDEFAALGLDPFTPEEEAAFRDAVDDVALDPEASAYLEFLYDECNLSSTLTNKRRSDDPGRFTHDRELAFGALVNGVSARRRRAIVAYARMLAFSLGDERATVDHVRAVVPYCLAHAIEFTDDFRADHADDRRDRGEREAMHLTRTLLARVDRNHDDLSETVRLLNAAVRGDDLSPDERETVERLVSGAPEPDHPHVRVWTEQAEESLRDRAQRPEADGGPASEANGTSSDRGPAGDEGGPAGDESDPYRDGVDVDGG